MSPFPERTAVLLDQHPLWLDAVERVVQPVGISVVGKATAPEEALRLVEEREPDILVTALELHGSSMDGLTLIRRARELQPQIKSIVVSMYRDPDHIDAALEAGADAYVVKTAHPDDLASAIRQAFEASIFLAGRPPAAAVTAHRQITPPAADESLGLTRRELEILQLMAEGHSNAQLAKMLWVTEQTVKFHLSNIYRKLDVSNRTEASRWAQLHGLLPAQPAAAMTA
jgi:DNA-binding NarL/FixJ family response regulator